MDEEMRAKAQELVDYLYRLGLKEDRILGVVNPLEIAKHVEQLTEWIKKNKITDPNEMRKQAIMISQN